MAANIKALIQELAAKAGLAADDKDLATLLGRPELDTIEVPEPVVNRLRTSLFDLEGAKNNYTIKSHFVSQTLAGYDKEFDRLAKEYGLNEQDMAELNGETNTYKKAGILAAKLKNMLAADGKKPDKDLQAKLDEIATLNTQLKEMKTAHQAELDKVRAEADKTVETMYFNTLLSGIDYKNKLPIEANLNNAKFFLQKQLAADGATMAFDKATQTWKMVKAADPSLEWYDSNNTKPVVPDYIKAALVKEGYIPVTDPEDLGARHEPIKTDLKEPGGNFFQKIDQRLQEVTQP